MTGWAERIAGERLQQVCSADLDLGGAGIVCPLDDFGVLKISGEDAEDFLHNQASNDLRELAAGEARLAALCNPKGRMYCSFLAFGGRAAGGAWYLQMPRERVAPVMKRLSMFVLRAKVELSDVSDELPGFGVIGAAANEMPERAAGAAGAVSASAAGANMGAGTAGAADKAGAGAGAAVMAFKTPGIQPRAAVYADGETLIELWRGAVQKGCRAMTCDAWRCCDIQSGIAHVSDATSEELVPQMANMDLLGGVSFSKGCYPGQEIVARTHYLGKLKRRTYLFSSDGRDVAAGAPVFSDRQTEPCGQVVDFCPLPDGPSPGLAMLRMAAAGDTLHIGAPDGATLSIGTQPYEISAKSHNPEDPNETID
ncbi:MAG: folate-binding protein [Gammaproteobacteria bacterium]|nr:folate-binding protein [Gammaproteobacteria bacterium]